MMLGVIATFQMTRFIQYIDNAQAHSHSSTYLPALSQRFPAFRWIIRETHVPLYT